MTAAVIDGEKVAHSLAAEVRAEAGALAVPAGLATVMTGEDYAARAYERRLDRMAAAVGVERRRARLPGDCTAGRLAAAIEELNGDPSVSGVALLRPFPPALSEIDAFTALDPAKDVEAVHPENAGLLALGRPRFVPSTPASAFLLLDRWLAGTGEDPAGFYHRSLIVVIGRSSNVGKPAVSLAYEREAAVTSIDIWASRSGRLGWHTRRADVLIVAAGVPGLIRAEHVRPGAIVIDVGINAVRAEDGSTRMAGDVCFDEVAGRAGAITPVPGGVGPVTDLCLLRNAVAARAVPDGAPSLRADRQRSLS